MKTRFPFFRNQAALQAIKPLLDITIRDDARLLSQLSVNPFVKLTKSLEPGALEKIAKVLQPAIYRGTAFERDLDSKPQPATPIKLSAANLSRFLKTNAAGTERQRLEKAAKYFGKKPTQRLWRSCLKEAPRATRGRPKKYVEEFRFKLHRKQ